MEHQLLEAGVRTDTGRAAARKARRDGKIPAVLYGRGEESMTVEVDAKVVVPRPGELDRRGCAEPARSAQDERRLVAGVVHTCLLK